MVAQKLLSLGIEPSDVVSQPTVALDVQHGAGAVVVIFEDRRPWWARMWRRRWAVRLTTPETMRLYQAFHKHMALAVLREEE